MFGNLAPVSSGTVGEPLIPEYAPHTRGSRVEVGSDTSGAQHSQNLCYS